MCPENCSFLWYLVVKEDVSVVAQNKEEVVYLDSTWYRVNFSLDPSRTLAKGQWKCFFLVRCLAGIFGPQGVMRELRVYDYPVVLSWEFCQIVRDSWTKPTMDLIIHFLHWDPRVLYRKSEFLGGIWGGPFLPQSIGAHSNVSAGSLPLQAHLEMEGLCFWFSYDWRSLLSWGVEEHSRDHMALDISWESAVLLGPL